MVFRATLSVLFAVVFSFTAGASATHEVRFVQSATVLVWQDGIMMGEGPEVSVREGETVAMRSFAGSGVLVSSTTERASQQQRMRLNIASNSGFTIETDNPDVAAHTFVRVVSRGLNAQNAAHDTSPASGFVFQQIQRTAVRPGTPLSQALELEITWTGSVRPALKIRATGS